MMGSKVTCMQASYLYILLIFGYISINCYILFTSIRYRSLLIQPLFIFVRYIYLLPYFPSFPANIKYDKLQFTCRSILDINISFVQPRWANYSQLCCFEGYFWIPNIVLDKSSDMFGIHVRSFKVNSSEGDLSVNDEYVVKCW